MFIRGNREKSAPRILPEWGGMDLNAFVLLLCIRIFSKPVSSKPREPLFV